MKILVTGGTGRIGSNLVKQLLEKGHSIRSFVYPGDVNRVGRWDDTERVETVLGDLREYEDVKKAVEGVDAIYHIAAAFGGPFDNRQYLAINGMGTLNILECIREFNPNIQPPRLLPVPKRSIGNLPKKDGFSMNSSPRTWLPNTITCPISLPNGLARNSA